MCVAEKGCQKPDELKGKPQDCSPDQVAKCHGEGEDHPCAPTGECEQPGRLHGRPRECSPEQITECHGDESGHPCVRNR